MYLIEIARKFKKTKLRIKRKRASPKKKHFLYSAQDIQYIQ